jgi:hypothetical protein
MTNKNIRLGWLTLIILLTNILVFGLYAGGKWLIKLNGEVKLTDDQFSKEYLAFVELQGILNPYLTSKKINELKNSNERKKQYFEGLVDESLIIEDAKRQKIFSEKQYDEKARILSNIIKKMLIKKIYIEKVVKKEAKKPSDKVIGMLYEQLNSKKETKKWSSKKKMKLAKKQAETNELKKALMFKLNQLVSKYKVKYNNIYDTE